MFAVKYKPKIFRFAKIIIYVLTVPFLVIANAEQIVFVFKSGSLHSTRTSTMKENLRVMAETF